MRLLVHAVTFKVVTTEIYFQTARTHHGNCTETLLDLISFLFDLMLQRIGSYIYP